MPENVYWGENIKKKSGENYSFYLIFTLNFSM